MSKGSLDRCSDSRWVLCPTAHEQYLGAVLSRPTQHRANRLPACISSKMSSRVFLIRHGETEGTWGMQHISTTDHKLSTAGEKQVELTREQYVGGGKLIDPKRVSRM
jgi:hypothetical protein